MLVIASFSEGRKNCLLNCNNNDPLPMYITQKGTRGDL